MTITPGSINGVQQTSTFLSRISEHAVVVNTTSSVVTEPVKVRAICLAPIVKRVPVNFFATTTYEGTSTTRFIGSATFVESAATLETRNIGTGTSVIRAIWAGEGRWRGFDFTTTSSFFLAPGFPFTGTVSLISNNDPIYQLNTGTMIATINTGTTATGSFIFKEGAITLATVPITSGKSVTWTFDPNILSTSTTAHTITAEWTGGRLDNIPFYGKTSNSIIQDVNTASLTLSLTSSTISIADEFTMIATANTSSINRTGLIEFKRDTTTLGTSTVSVNSGTLTLAPGSFTSGTYQISATYLGTSPLVNATRQLVVNNRAPWGGTFELIGQTSAYQLDPQTFTFTTNLNTATSGNIFLQEISGATVRNIGTATFSTSTISFVVNPNNYAFPSLSTHRFRISWAGQTWLPGVYYPYNATISNTLTQVKTLATLTAVTLKQNNIETLPTTFVATLNTTTSKVGTVDWFLNGTLLQTVGVIGTSATITVNSGTMVVGSTNRISARLNNTNPVVVSNTVTQTILAYVSPTFRYSTSTFVYYNQDNTINTSTLAYTVTVTGPYSGNPPTGNVTVSDTQLGLIGTATLSSSSAVTSTAMISWSPAAIGQTVSTATLSIVYSGDDWNKAITTSTALSIIRPTASISITATSTSSFYVGYPITLTATKTTSTTLANQIVFINANSGGVYGTASFVGNTATINVNLPEGAYNIRAVYEADTFHARSESPILVVNSVKEAIAYMTGYYNQGGGVAQDGEAANATQFVPSDTLTAGIPVVFGARLWNITGRPLSGNLRFAGETYANFNAYSNGQGPRIIDVLLASRTLNGSITPVLSAYYEDELFTPPNVGYKTDVLVNVTPTMAMNNAYTEWILFDGDATYSALNIRQTGQLEILPATMTLDIEYLKNGIWYSAWPYTPGDTIQGYRITRNSTSGVAWTGNMTVTVGGFTGTFIGQNSSVVVTPTGLIDYGIRNSNLINASTVNSSVSYQIIVNGQLITRTRAMADTYHGGTSSTKPNPYPNGPIPIAPDINSVQTGSDAWATWNANTAPVNVTLTIDEVTGPVPVPSVAYNFRILYSILNTSNNQYEEWTPPAGSEAVITSQSARAFSYIPAKPPVGRTVNTTFWIGSEPNPYNLRNETEFTGRAIEGTTSSR